MPDSRARPNIVFLLNDHQVNYRHGQDGGPRIQRPNFDRVARDGVVFERAYSACPLCGPARRTMLTGLYPHNHREIKNDTNHPFDRDNYLDILADSGYRNYYYGKWHAGPGTAFDHQCEGFNYPSYNNPYTKPEYKEYLERKDLPTPEIRIERSFWGPKLQGGRPNPMKAGETYRQESAWCNEHATGIMTTPKDTHEAFFLANEACDRLRALAADDSDQPFHLRVDFWGPHQPYFVTQEYADLYDPKEIPVYGSHHDDLSTKPEIYRTEGNYPLHEKGKIITPSPLPWEEWQKALALAYAQVTLVDAAAGRILDALDELGLADNTIVVWTTDHGDALASHGGHFDKRSYMPEEMIRVPMTMRWPGKIAPGQTSQALTSNLDVAPTILGAAGLGFDQSVDGADLTRLAIDPGIDWRDGVVCETHGHAEEHIGRALVCERFKYIANYGQLDELYDLENDPFEMTNLIDDAAHAETLAELRQRLAVWQAETTDCESVI